MQSHAAITEVASNYEFRVATVFRRTFSAYRSGFALFLLLGGACASMRWLIGPIYSAVMRPLLGWGLNGYWGFFLGSLVYSFFLGIAGKAAVAFAVFWTDDILTGNRPRVARGLRGGIFNILVVLVGAIITTFATCVGMVLLVIPGLVAACLFVAIAPAASFEKLGIVASIKRGASLAKRNLGRIFVLNVIPYAILYGYIQLAYRLRQLYSPGLGNDSVSYLLYILPANILYDSFIFALACVIYFELRASREGMREQNLVDVFE
ncbi:hypothetical protein ACMDCR_12130 [Labrys okinawensis]|uniref:hypothetical protein n=1 Tax=Labrys okinawensis TaxID=346911 RepID=UPI0039BCB059